MITYSVITNTQHPTRKEEIDFLSRKFFRSENDGLKFLEEFKDYLNEINFSVSKFTLHTPASGGNIFEIYFRVYNKTVAKCEFKVNWTDNNKVTIYKSELFTKFMNKVEFDRTINDFLDKWNDTISHNKQK